VEAQKPNGIVKGGRATRRTGAFTMAAFGRRSSASVSPAVAPDQRGVELSSG
jgi:hypothetical protein